MSQSLSKMWSHLILLNQRALSIPYGQMQSSEFGITRGICLEENPSCSLCGVRDHCKLFRSETTPFTRYLKEEGKLRRVA